MRKVPSAQEIKRQLCERLFGGSLIQNNIRGEYIEQLVANCLSGDWRHCAEDWAGWDFERADGVRLQVKQSAALQTWGLTKVSPRLSIAPTTGYYINGSEWVAKPGRHAELYLFGWHGITDSRVDHADPLQWKFYIVPASDFPLEAKSISIKAIAEKFDPVDVGGLAKAIDIAADELRLDR